MPTVLDFYEFSKLATASYVVLDPNALTGVSIAARADDQERIPATLANTAFVKIPGVNPSVWSIPKNGYHANDGTGFAATLFEKNGKKVLAIRGTEFGDSGQRLKDLILADFAGIGVLGLALAQAVSMFNWINLLRTPTDQYAAQLQIRSSTTDPRTRDPSLKVVTISSGMPLLQVHFYLVSSAVEGLGAIDKDETISVTGHSLGGHLATLAARLFPKLVSEAYIYNSPGFDPTSTNLVRSVAFLASSFLTTQMGLAAAGIFPGANQKTEKFVGLLEPYVRSAFGVSPASSLNGLRIYNVESEDSAPGNDLSIVSSVITGSQVLGEEAFITTEGNSHLIEPLMDSLALQALIYSMNLSLSPGQIGRVFEAASNKGSDTQEKLVEALYKLFKNRAVSLIPVDVEKDDPIFGSAGIGSGNIEGRRDYYEKLTDLEGAIKANPSVTFSSLIGVPTNELITRAQAANGLAYRYALEELNPFAVLGPDSLYARHNADGTLDRFDPELPSSAGMTESYLADRVAMLAWKIKDYSADGQSVLKGDTVETYKYIDKALKSSAGIDLTFTVLGTKTSSVSIPAFVAFGSEASETLSGGDVTVGDHLYGRGGDDELRGMGGDDYLEGNAGNDALIGGSNDDVLLGGPGFDTYLYRMGDGFDTIFDSDGSGEINYNERALTGGSKVAGGLYEDALGVEYRFFDEAEDSGLLLINDEILVEDFHPGMLGLVFNGEPEFPPQPESAPVNVYDGSDLPTGFDSDDYNDLLRVSHGSGVDDLFLVSDQMSGVFGRSGNDAALLDGSPYGLDVDMGSGDDYIDARASSGSAFAARLSGGAGSDYILGGAGNDNVWGDNYVLIRRPYAGSFLTIVDSFFYNSGQSAGTGLLAGLEAGQGVFGAPFRDLSSRHGFQVGEMGALVPDGTFFDGSLEGAIKNVQGEEGDFDDFIDAGAGDDFVVGGSGADRIFGGEGSDSILGDYGGGPLDAPSYQRLADFFGPPSLLFGRPGDDVIDGGSGEDYLRDLDGGDDVLIGGEGDDVILSVEAYWTPTDGPGARNVIHGDAGDDSIEVHNATGGLDFVDGGDGDDQIRVYASRYEFYDEESDTETVGTVDGRAFVFGGSGNDFLLVNADNGVVDGGTGNDDYTVYGRSITISDPSGDDTLRFPILLDFASRDHFLEVAPTESEDGFATESWSVFVVREGSDLVANMRLRDAGELLDSLEYRIRDWFGGTTVPIEHLTVSDGSGGEVALDPAALETWGGFHEGGSGADELLDATDYEDLSLGRGGNDLISTGAGNDRIYGGTGNDELHGGAGDDLYFYAAGDGDDFITDESGFDELRLGLGISVSDVTAAVHETGIVLTAGIGKIEVVGGSRGDPGIEQIRFSDGTIILTESLLPEAIVATETPAGGVQVIIIDSADPSSEEDGATGYGEAQTSILPATPAVPAEMAAHPVPSSVASFDLPESYIDADLGVRVTEANAPTADIPDHPDSASGARDPGDAAPPDLQTMLDAIQAFNTLTPGGVRPGSVATARSLPRAGESEDDARSGSALTSLALTNALLLFHLQQSEDRGVPDGAAEWFQQTDAFAGIGVASGLSSFGPTSFGRQTPGLATFAGLQEGFTRLA